MPTWYLDLENGNDANAGTSFATRKKTLESVAAAGWAAGDAVRIMSSALPTDSGVNITVTNQSNAATLSSAITKDIDACDTGWVAGTNVTVTQSGSNLRQGAASTSCAIAAAFTTGIVAYKDLGSSQDFSAFQQVSFWIYGGSAVSAGVLTLRLCSDAVGATPVNTIAIPALTSARWARVVVDNGSALGNSIRSVSISAASDPGTVTVAIDCIFASKAPGAADELTLFSLVGVNNDSPTDDDTWLPIRSVIGTTIGLDGTMDDGATSGRVANWPLATQTTRMYLRQPAALTTAITYTTAPTGDTAANPITIEGGWNRTDMSTKVGRTYIRRTARAVSVVAMSAPHGIILKSIAACYAVNNTRTTTGSGFEIGPASAHSFLIEDCIAIGCYMGFRVTTADWFKTKDVSCIFCYWGFYFPSATIGNNVPPLSIKFRNMWGAGNPTYGFDFTDVNQTNERLFFAEFYGGLMAGWQSPFFMQTRGNGRFSLRNVEVKYSNSFDINSAAIIDLWKFKSDVDGNAIGSLVRGAKLTLAGNAIEGYNWRNNWNARALFTATDQRRTASGYSWKMTTATFASTYGQNTFKIASIICPANQNRTVNLWARFDGSNVACRLMVPGGLYAGIPNDVSDTTAGPINTWEQLSISFTPTEDCVVDVFAQAEITTGGTRSFWFNDLSTS